MPGATLGLVARGPHTIRTEVIGGITTFLSMAYIIIVNPAILAFAGIPPGPSTVATILTAAFGITWQQRLGAVFVSGVLFLIITLLGVRSRLAEAISPSMKHSFAVGIGLFLTFIGLYETGIVVSAKAVPV